MDKVQEIKTKLGPKAKEIILNGLGIQEVRGKILCPLHTEKTPSMSWYADGLCFKCHACGGTIDIYEYYTKFRGFTFKEALEEVRTLTGDTGYIRPNIQLKELTQPFLGYMEKRKLTKETLDSWGVKQTTWGGNEVYVFPYYLDGKLEYVTYRGLGKGALKGGAEKNTKPILYGMDQIDPEQPLIITEGQIDAMSIWQAGYKNVVSVPAGANNLKWIETCFEWLEQFSRIIVFADNDGPGLKMATNIQSRLKNVEVLKDENHKDANEILFYQGPESLLNLIQEAINKTPIGLLVMDKIPYETNLNVLETIETGLKDYDRHVEDWKTQEITVIFGRNNEGKTTLVSQIIAHNLENNVGVFLYSGEMGIRKVQDWLYRQVIGGNKKHLRTIACKYRDKSEPRPEAIESIKRWHAGKLFMYDRYINAEHSIDKFFQIAEHAISKYDVKLVVIDNLMAILEENADSLFSDQANFVQRCKDFSIQNNCHVVLVAHPNKLKKEGIALEKNDISGSSNISNKADNIISIERSWSEGRTSDATITSLKDRETGQRAIFYYDFCQETLRFHNLSTPREAHYSWEAQQGMVPLDSPTPFDEK